MPVDGKTVFPPRLSRLRFLEFSRRFGSDTFFLRYLSPDPLARQPRRLTKHLAKRIRPSTKIVKMVFRSLKGGDSLKFLCFHPLEHPEIGRSGVIAGVWGVGVGSRRTTRRVAAPKGSYFLKVFTHLGKLLN